MANATKKDEFNPNNEFKASIDKIERPDMFAEVFCKAAESQTCIKEVLGKLIRENIKENKEVHEVSKGLFKEIIAEDKKYFLKLTWDKFKSLIMIVLGGVGTLFLQWIAKKLDL